VTAPGDPAHNAAAGYSARPPLTKDYLTGESERSDVWLAEQRWFADHDVSLRLGTEVVALDRARPNTELAERSGLKLDHGGVPTDASLATVDEHVLAVGDIAYASNTAAGRRIRMEHWGDAV
jgi:NAD(P)H-nitrite reductase large subunit